MRGLNQTLLLVLVSTAALGADWSPKKAAEYLDGRQKEWFAWPRAASADGPCVSCHTGLTLGPWAAHADAPVTAGSNSYATGFTANALVQADKSLSRSALPQTWEWLKSHQDSESGAWPAASMNNRYPPGSMEEHFMQDAATAFAVLALIEAGQ